MLSAEPVYGWRFRHLEQFGLSPHRELADFVEKNRSVIGQFEFALVKYGSCKGASFATEKLLFDEVVRQGAAIHLNKSSGGPVARQMDFLRHQILAGPGSPRTITVALVGAVLAISSRISSSFALQPISWPVRIIQHHLYCFTRKDRPAPRYICFACRALRFVLQSCKADDSDFQDSFHDPEAKRKYLILRRKPKAAGLASAVHLLGRVQTPKRKGVSNSQKRREAQALASAQPKKKGENDNDKSSEVNQSSGGFQ